MPQVNSKDFFLGKIFNLETKKLEDKPLFYDPSDLTTHAFVTGMTGSGKTGLCVGVLEEAALKNIPAIMVDPKGDLTNLLLHFPDLLPSDFEPWVDAIEAKRQGKDVAVVAQETAESWKSGLESWGLGHDDIERLSKSVDFAIYTPGSTSGEPVNILSSFNRADLGWNDNQEILRDKIASTVTALLGLIGFKDIDPLRSREHILLSTLMEHAWSQGKLLDLNELIIQVQQPPIDRLGAFPVDSFFPEKERFQLAMLLNNFLASPSFQVWVNGSPLDVKSFLYTPEGKARHSIFYLAHLNDNERMFFVTLLYSAIETWMFTQRGTGSLRALVYFDEVHGYLPPVANPPSKPLFIRLLKQARAFGVGLILATQNPVDVDYKALSNAGTWMIGRLQTDQDKQRLLDGLSEVSGVHDRSAYDKMISSLGKRTFLLHNVHDSAPSIFQTRWVMNYLAGPLTRTQIPALMKLIGKTPFNGSTDKSQASISESIQGSPSSQTPVTGVTQGGYSSTKPIAASSLTEYFYPADQDFKRAAGSRASQQQSDGIVYHPALIAQADVRYYSRTYNLDFSKKFCTLLEDADDRAIHWEDYLWQEQDKRSLHTSPMAQSTFGEVPVWLSDDRRVKSLKSDFADWVYRTGVVHVKVNKTLKSFAEPDVSDEDFRTQCREAAENFIREESEKYESTIDKKIQTLQQKINRQELEVKEQQQELTRRRFEVAGTVGELALSLLSKRKKSVSSSLSKTRMSSKAKANLEQEIQELEFMQKQLADLEEEKTEALVRIKEKWDAVADEIEDVPLNPTKKDIFLDIFDILWMPYYLYDDGGRQREVKAYQE